MAISSGITIYDIAKEAGVSPATVSRVLTGKARVSEKKERSIKNLIEKYNFRPNAIARNLSHSRSKVLGMIAADIRNPYYAALAVACEEAANRRGYTLLLCNALSNNSLEEANIQKLYAHRVDAIIQVGCRVDDCWPDPEYIEYLSHVSNEIPFITTNDFKVPNCYSLSIDHRYAMQLVMEYLTSLEHRKIAFVGGEKKIKSSYDKQRRYRELIKMYGLSEQDCFIQESSYSDVSGYECMMRILDEKKLPTAVIAVNDFCAMGILKAIREKGLVVPEHISVISFDNTFLSNALSPSLCSVDYRYPEYGNFLVDLSIRASLGEKLPLKQYIKPNLVIRESCTKASVKSY